MGDDGLALNFISEGQAVFSAWLVLPLVSYFPAPGLNFLGWGRAQVPEWGV
jgi:hypothetical protein